MAKLIITESVGPLHDTLIAHGYKQYGAHIRGEFKRK